MLMLECLAREVVTRWEHGDLAETVRARDRHLQEVAEHRGRHRGLIQRAVGLYADDDIEIDANSTLISESQEGAFVMGWLWMPRHDDKSSTAGAHAEATLYPEEGAKPQ